MFFRGSIQSFQIQDETWGLTYTAVSMDDTWRESSSSHPLQITCSALRRGARAGTTSPDYVQVQSCCDEIVAEDQPGAEDASPTAQSPDYVPKSDPEADPEEDDDEDPEEDPVDYPANGGDDGDDEMDIEEDEEDDMDISGYEENEDDGWMLEGGTWTAEEDSTQLPAYPVARNTIPELCSSVPIPAWSDSELIGYRGCHDAEMRAEAFANYSHSLPLPPPFILSPTRLDAPPPLPTSAPTLLPPLLLPSASRREDIPEVNLPPRRRLGITLGPRYEVGESSAAAAARPAGGLRADYGFVATIDREIRRDPERDVGYRITDLWDEIVETLQGAPVSTDTELGAYMREFEFMVRRDTDEIYTMLDDEQSQRQLLAGRVNMLFRDRRALAHTRHLMETEARMSREAWRRSIDASDLARAEGQVTALQGQQGPARGPAQPELPEEASSSSLIRLCYG
ncbi:hypothetical protein Tco_0154515 [Tanacetum coccineum]